MIIIWGYGKLGIKYYDEYCAGKKVLFVDNNLNKQGEKDNVSVVSVMKLKEIYDEDLNIVIASSRWKEIYNTCILNNWNDVIIYDGDATYSYIDKCIKDKCFFENRSHIIYENNLEKRINSACEAFKKNYYLLNNICRVSIMISNICNYACVHKLCPAAKMHTKETMPLINIKKIIDELIENDFCGILAFHIYNEPLIDPRLFYLIDYVRKTETKMDILVYSNGFYLTQNICDELVEMGVSVIKTTAYSMEEYNRLVGINVSIPYSVLYGSLDSRLDIYDRATPYIVPKKVCRSMISELCIYSNGDIGLCCLDYKHNHNLGNIKDASLKDLLDNDDTKRILFELLDGKRSYEICKRCGWSR